MGVWRTLKGGWRTLRVRSLRLRVYGSWFSGFDVREIDFRSHDRAFSSQARNLVIVIVKKDHQPRMFVNAIVNSFIVSGTQFMNVFSKRFLHSKTKLVLVRLEPAQCMSAKKILTTSPNRTSSQKICKNLW